MKESNAAASMKLRTILKGGYGRNAADGSAGREAVVRVAVDEETFRRIWQSHINADEIPAVDFKRESVVFLLLGSRSTGGFDIVPADVTVTGGVATINAPVTAPASDSIVTMALTSPYAVVAVPMPGLRSAEWMDNGRLLGKSTQSRQ